MKERHDSQQPLLELAQPHSEHDPDGSTRDDTEPVHSYTVPQLSRMVMSLQMKAHALQTRLDDMEAHGEIFEAVWRAALVHLPRDTDMRMELASVAGWAAVYAGNISAIAARLGRGRQWVYRRMERLQDLLSDRYMEIDDHVEVSKSQRVYEMVQMYGTDEAMRRMSNG